jgi:hypothetical protein
MKRVVKIIARNDIDAYLMKRNEEKEKKRY